MSSRPGHRFSTFVLRLRKLCVVERFTSLHTAVSDDDEPEPVPIPPDPADVVGAAEAEPEEPEAVAVGTVAEPEDTAPDPANIWIEKVYDAPKD